MRVVRLTGLFITVIPCLCADLNLGLVAYYDFDEPGAPGIANQVPTASEFNLVWRGSPQESDSGFAGSADFRAIDGTSDRSELLAGRALNLIDHEDAYLVLPVGNERLGNSFSIAAWHYLAPGSSNSSERFFVFESNNNYSVSWGIRSGDDYAAYLDQTFAGIRSLPRGSWHHVVHSFDNDGGVTTLRVYINGELAFSHTVASSQLNFDSLHLGRARSGTGDRDWDGMLDEVAVWERVLTVDEQSEIYRLGRAGLPILENDRIWLNLSTNNPKAGMVLGGGWYARSSQANISAVPAPGYIFEGWSGDFSGNEAQFEITMVEALQGQALFTEDLGDDDGDGLSNHEERTRWNTRADFADSDGDGLSDTIEIRETGTDPIHDDSAVVESLRGLVSSSSSNIIQLRAFAAESSQVAAAIRLELLIEMSNSSERSESAIPVRILQHKNHWELFLPVPNGSPNGYRLVTGTPP
jgi:hypothetical protein